MGRSDSRGTESLSGMGEWVSFREIKRRITLEQVLRAYAVTWLRRSGVNQYRGRCPIHRGEGKEAFHANLTRGVFHCFACGAGGNVLDFVTAMEGSSLREAALRLQACIGDGSVVAGAAVAAWAERKLVTKKRIVNPPLDFALQLDGRHVYLQQRGISSTTADHFGVGYFRGRGLMSGRIAIPICDDVGGLWWLTAAAPWMQSNRGTDFLRPSRSPRCCSIMIRRARRPATR